MHAEQVDSLILKFKQLWKTGFDAHLDLHTHAGQAWVSLHVRLGHSQEHRHQRYDNRSRNGPSRQRRREKRANARRDAEKATENLVPNEGVSEIATMEAEEATSKVLEIETNDEKADEKSDESEEIEINEVNGINTVMEKQNEEKCETSEKSFNEEPDEKHENAEVDTVMGDEHRIGVEKTGNCQNEVPQVVVVNATAIIDDSPNQTLTNDDVQAIIKILTSKDHLANNIANIEYAYLSSREFRKNFKHTVGLAISVRTSNLWEGARSYIWKHIGRDTWTLRNGAEVNIVRIHQK